MANTKVRTTAEIRTTLATQPKEMSAADYEVLDNMAFIANAERDITASASEAAALVAEAVTTR